MYYTVHCDCVNRYGKDTGEGKVRQIKVPHCVGDVGMKYRERDVTQQTPDFACPVVMTAFTCQHMPILLVHSFSCTHTHTEERIRKMHCPTSVSDHNVTCPVTSHLSNSTQKFTLRSHP